VSAVSLPDSGDYLAVSRRHAVIELSRDRAALRDLCSLNGAFINGRLVSRREEDRGPGFAVTGFGVRVKDGDIVTLAGLTSFRLGKG
jgi:pSer/pThr/pTyr-binding forkhead associated (FHA) protein